jgi:hypothetical protein
MFSTLVAHVRNRVVGALVVGLVVTGGVAYAAGTPSPTTPDTSCSTPCIYSSNIFDGQVKNVDLGADAVTSAKVSDNTLTGTDVKESSLGTVPSAGVAGVGASAQSTYNSCIPTGGSFINCVTVTLNLPRAGSVLVNATGAFRPNDNSVKGISCRLGSDSTVTPGSTVFISSDKYEYFALTAVAGPLSAGSHVFEMGCNNENSYGNFDVADSQISAIEFMTKQ